MNNFRIDMVRGQAALDILVDRSFLGAWRALHDACLHATAYQSPGFVCSWYHAYRNKWDPIIVRGFDSAQELVGLWFLAYDAGTNVLAHAGAHQAEYHAWLALPGHDSSFLAAAWLEVRHRLAFATLQFKYLPSPALADMLLTVPGLRAGVVSRRHSRPLLKLDPVAVKASLAKKSNKSRFNRLKRLGRLEFRRITDPLELERVFDDLIACYDLRQGAINHSSPFREDPYKRQFYSEYFAAAPEEAYVCVTYLDEMPMAAFWGTASAKTVHLGMLIHSPVLAEHSPGKIHVMQLSEHLLADGKDVLDLTPGGDAWKDRFANAHDDVVEVLVYRSEITRRRVEIRDRLIGWSKSALARVGVTPDDLRSAIALVRRIRPAAVIRKIKNWAGIQREYRVYRGDRALAQGCSRDSRVQCNVFATLVSFEPGESWQTRSAFLSSALSRLEQGEAAYTISIDNRLAHCGWMVANQKESWMTEVQQSMVLPDGSVALYDYHSHPDFRGRGLYRATLGHMVCEAFADEQTQYAYICALADNVASRHVIETMGFDYVGSLFLKCRFGAEKKWVSGGVALAGGSNG